MHLVQSFVLTSKDHVFHIACSHAADCFCAAAMYQTTLFACAFISFAACCFNHCVTVDLYAHTYLGS